MTLAELFQRLFPYQPASQPWSAILDNPTFQLSFHCLLINSALLLLALLWGIGLCGWLARSEKNPRAILHASTLVMVCVAVGIAIMIAQLFLLAGLHSLNIIGITFLFFGSSALAAYSLLKNQKYVRSVILPQQGWHSVMTGCLVLFLVIYQLSSISYWQISDATAYHLPYADFFLSNKGLSAVPEYLIYPYHSLNFNLLYSLGLLIERDLAYLQTLHALFATLSVLGVYTFCLSLGNKHSIAMITTLAFVITARAVLYNRMGANVDCGSMFFVLTTALCLILWSKTGVRWLLVFSAISLGMAIGTKYLMGIFVLPVAISICITEKKILPRSLFIYAAWAAAWGSWWYLRNIFLTGNPVHPFASDIFGQYLWNDQDVKFQMGALLDTRVPRTLLGFLLMPYYATQNIILVDQGVHKMLLMLYLSTLFCWLLNRYTNLLLLFSWIYLLAWFLGAQDPRYMMPVMPLIAVHFGSLLHRLLCFLKPPFITRLISALIAIIAINQMANHMQLLLIRSLDSGAGASRETIEANLRQNSTYDLIEHADALFDRDAIVFEFFMREVRWFYDGNLIGNQFGPHSYYRVIDASVNDDGQPGLSPEKLERLLTEKYAADGFIIPPPPYILYNQQEFDNYFPVMYRNPAGTVYKLDRKTSP